MINRPTNSPDLNILDLSYFSAIQGLQYEKALNGLEELISAVLQSFDELAVDKLENNFLTLQKVMECVMLCDGGNDFKWSHLHKARAKK